MRMRMWFLQTFKNLCRKAMKPAIFDNFNRNLAIFSKSFKILSNFSLQLGK